MIDINLPKPPRAAVRRGELLDWPADDADAEPAPVEAASGRAADTTDAEGRVFALAVAPWLTPSTRAIEIGPGAGKWTVQIAPLVGALVVVDVDAPMIARTRARLQAAEMHNVDFVLGSGRDLAPLESDRFDLVFGYDVFVHIALDDTVAYLGEIARVLRDGGVAVLHHAVNDVRPAWDRIEADRDRAPDVQAGPYCYHSRDALDRMYGRFGLRVDSVWTDVCTAVVTARKPADSLVPRLEQALRMAASAGDGRALDDAARAIAGVGSDLTDRLAALTTRLAATLPGPDRYEVIQQIRRLIRG